MYFKTINILFHIIYMERIKIPFNDINKNFDIKNSLSVSKLISYIKEPFDKEKVAYNVYKKNFKNQYSKYYNKSVDEILSLWDAKSEQAKSLGSSLDLFIKAYTKDIYNNIEYFKSLNSEEYKNNFKKVFINLYNSCLCKERFKNVVEGFIYFYNNLISNRENIIIDDGLELITEEQQLFYQYNNYLINGRLDALFYSKISKKYILIDYKTTENIDIFNSFDKYLKGPCWQLYDCNLNEYTLQLHLYKLALQKTYNIKNEIDCYICQCGTSNKQKYTIWRDNFAYSEDLLNLTIEYAYKCKNTEMQ